MPEISNVRIAIRLLWGMAMMAGVFFLSAGTPRWPEAWILLVLFASQGLFNAIWLKKHDPALLEERMKFGKRPTRGWDRVFMVTATILLIPYLILPGLDAVRYQWSSVPLWVKVLAFAGMAASVAVIMWVLKVNSFASRVVEIQESRGHKVITTGPYHYVRHPMYAAVIPFFFFIPLALGSLWTLVLSAAMTVLFVIRTALEDKTLKRELEGYADYARATRYRLVPGIW